jgi:hypothetical protein
MQDSYRALAAGVIKFAVVDLKSAYKKVEAIKHLELEGKLEDYVLSKVKKRRPVRLYLTHDEETALKFFKDNNEYLLLYLFASGLEKLPSEIVRMRDFINKNYIRLRNTIENIKELAI